MFLFSGLAANMATGKPSLSLQVSIYQHESQAQFLVPILTVNHTMTTSDVPLEIPFCKHRMKTRKNSYKCLFLNNMSLRLNS